MLFLPMSSIVQVDHWITSHVRKAGLALALLHQRDAHSPEGSSMLHRGSHITRRGGGAVLHPLPQECYLLLSSRRCSSPSSVVMPLLYPFFLFLTSPVGLPRYEKWGEITRAAPVRNNRLEDHQASAVRNVFHNIFETGIW